MNNGVSNRVHRLMNLVRSRVPGCLDAQIQLEMFEMFDEFFKNTNSWREEIPIDIVAGVQEYDIIPIGVCAINTLIGIRRHDHLHAHAVMPIPGQLVLRHRPSENSPADHPWHVIVSLYVTDPTDKNGYPMYPTWILDRYHSGFVDGLVGRLMSQPNKPYTNPNMSVYHLRRWRNVMAGARIDAVRNNTYGAQAWVYPQQFQTFPRHGGDTLGFPNWSV